MTLQEFEEHRCRLEQMAREDDEQWDLSPNDRAAIRAVLDDYRKVRESETALHTNLFRLMLCFWVQQPKDDGPEKVVLKRGWNAQRLFAYRQAEAVLDQCAGVDDA